MDKLSGNFIFSPTPQDHSFAIAPLPQGVVRAPSSLWIAPQIICGGFERTGDSLVGFYEAAQQDENVNAHANDDADIRDNKPDPEVLHIHGGQMLKVSKSIA